MIVKVGLVLIFLMIFILGCTNKADSVNYDKLCVEKGYVPVNDVNRLITVTNTLVDLSNSCLGENFSHLSYYGE